MVHSTYQARRPMKIGTEFRQPGELVPEAETWPRAQHLIHSGRMVAVVITDEEFADAVEKFCPDLADVLLEGIDMEDLAAKRALARQGRMATDPGTTLAETLAAPRNDVAEPDAAPAEKPKSEKPAEKTKK